MKRLLAEVRANPVATGCRMHPETIAALKAHVALDRVATRPWLAPPFGVPVYVDDTVAIGEVEWDYPETDVTE